MKQQPANQEVNQKGKNKKSKKFHLKDFVTQENAPSQNNLQQNCSVYEPAQNATMGA